VPEIINLAQIYNMARRMIAAQRSNQSP